MPVCLCCLSQVEFYKTAKDNTNLCAYCEEEGLAEIKDGQVVILKEFRLAMPKKRGRKPKGFSEEEN